MIAERLAGFVDLGFTALNFSPIGPDEEGQIERIRVTSCLFCRTAR